MKRKRTLRVLQTVAFASVACAAPLAHADDQTAGSLMTGKPATSGATDVATAGFEKHHAVPAAEAEKNTTSLQISGGALSSSGNSNTLALTGSSRFKARRDNDELSLAVAGNYAESASKSDQSMQMTFNLRYDNAPLPTVKNTDTITAANLVYQLL
jgi:hypothetical protein